MSLPNLLTSSTTGVLLLALIFNIAKASAAPSPDTIKDMFLPSPNATGGPIAEIQCYALPYGAVGIISHLLTYWSMAWLCVGRVPVWPWHRIHGYKFDLALAIVGLCTCVPIASITIHRCRLSWHFILIGIWKLVTSVSMSCITIHRCILICRGMGNNNVGSHFRLQDTNHEIDYYPHPHSQQPDSIHHYYINNHNGQNQNQQTQNQNNSTPLWWLLLYLAGTVVGMVGLCSLLWTTFRQNQTVERLTYGFAAPVVIIPLLVAIYFFQYHLDRFNGGVKVLLSAYLHTLLGAIIAFAVVFGFFSSLYGDLVLGAIADNLLGLPSIDYAPLYWIWFVAKRLPLLSF